MSTAANFQSLSWLAKQKKKLNERIIYSIGTFVFYGFVEERKVNFSYPQGLFPIKIVKRHKRHLFHLIQKIYIFMKKYFPGG